MPLCGALPLRCPCAVPLYDALPLHCPCAVPLCGALVRWVPLCGALVQCPRAAPLCAALVRGLSYALLLYSSLGRCSYAALISIFSLYNFLGRCLCPLPLCTALHVQCPPCGVPSFAVPSSCAAFVGCIYAMPLCGVIHPSCSFQ